MQFFLSNYSSLAVPYNSIYNARHLWPKTQIMPNLQITFSIFTAPNTTGSDHLYNTVELLMMGIMVPETCWASNKICNKKHLLHLVGILFPHINDDAQSESLHILCNNYVHYYWIRIMRSREERTSSSKYVEKEDARRVTAVIVYRSCALISVISSTYVCPFYWSFCGRDNTMF